MVLTFLLNAPNFMSKRSGTKWESNALFVPRKQRNKKNYSSQTKATRSKNLWLPIRSKLDALAPSKDLVHVSCFQLPWKSHHLPNYPSKPTKNTQIWHQKIINRDMQSNSSALLACDRCQELNLRSKQKHNLRDKKIGKTCKR